jgi:hypothetical protein
MNTVLWQFRFLQHSARSCDVQSFPGLRPLTRCFLSYIMQAAFEATRQATAPNTDHFGSALNRGLDQRRREVGVRAISGQCREQSAALRPQSWSIVFQRT